MTDMILNQLKQCVGAKGMLCTIKGNYTIVIESVNEHSRVVKGIELEESLSRTEEIFLDGLNFGFDETKIPCEFSFDEITEFHPRVID
jgi:hypothetical protein